MANNDEENYDGQNLAAQTGEMYAADGNKTKNRNNNSNSSIGNDLVNALVRAFSADSSAESMQDAQDALSRALASISASREGLKTDSRDFYDETMGTLANDVKAFMPLTEGANAGALRGEQYGKDLTSYVDKAIAAGQGQIDNRVNAGLGRLSGARDTALSDLAAIFLPALGEARGEVSHQRKLGQDVIDFTTKGANDARRITTPMLESTAARYQAPNQYTTAGIRGLLARQALAGVGDAFDKTQRAAVNQAVRSGSNAGSMLSDIARERSDASSSALLDAEVKALGLADSLNLGRRDSEAKNFVGLSDSLRAREALVPQAYDTASKGSLGASGLVAQLAAAYGGQTGNANNQYMANVGDLSKAGVTSGADLSKTGATVGAAGFNTSASSAVAGDASKNALTKSLIDNYFAGGRGAAGDVQTNLGRAWVGDQQGTASIAPKQASTSAVQAQSDPFGVLANQVVGGVIGKAAGKGVDWLIDKGTDWVSNLF